MTELERTIEVVSKDKILLHRLLAEALEAHAKEDWLLDAVEPETRAGMLREVCV